MNTSPRNVSVIDYGLGNLFSVRSACEKVGIEAVITSDPAVISNSYMAILPGVGAFGDAVESLKRKGIADSIISCVNNGAYLVGICLGMQLLMSRSEEFGDHEGLNLIKGRVRRFPQSKGDGQLIKVPNVGWLPVQATLSSDSNSLNPFNSFSAAQMYFVHSYFVEPYDESVITLKSEYEGIEFCAGLRLGNILGFQFHPERSGESGLAVYRVLAQYLKRTTDK